jgi:hypothetical protein
MTQSQLFLTFLKHICGFDILPPEEKKIHVASHETSNHKLKCKQIRKNTIR